MIQKNFVIHVVLCSEMIQIKCIGLFLFIDDFFYKQNMKGGKTWLVLWGVGVGGCCCFVFYGNSNVKFFPLAIDMSSNIFSSLHSLIELKFDRVLTSGGAATALDGVPIIEKMIQEVHTGPRSVWMLV